MPTWHREVRIGENPSCTELAHCMSEGKQAVHSVARANKTRAAGPSLPCRHQAEAQHQFWCLTCTPSSSVTECLWACTMLVRPAGSRAAQQPPRTRCKATLQPVSHSWHDRTPFAAASPDTKQQETCRRCCSRCPTHTVPQAIHKHPAMPQTTVMHPAAADLLACIASCCHSNIASQAGQHNGWQHCAKQHHPMSG